MVKKTSKPNRLAVIHSLFFFNLSFASSTKCSANQNNLPLVLSRKTGKLQYLNFTSLCTAGLGKKQNRSVFGQTFSFFFLTDSIADESHSLSGQSLRI